MPTLARLPGRRDGPNPPVTALAGWSGPEGPRLASPGDNLWDGRRWNACTLWRGVRCARYPPTNSGVITLVAWDGPQAPMLASGELGPGTSRVGNAVLGARSASHRPATLAGAGRWPGMDPEGPMLASASDDRTVPRWERRPLGNEVGDPMTGHTGWVRALVAWDGPEGPMLASASDDGTVRRWDATSGNEVGDPMTGTDSPGKPP